MADWLHQLEYHRSKYAAAACVLLLAAHALTLAYIPSSHAQSASYVFMLLDSAIAVTAAALAASRGSGISRSIWLLFAASQLFWSIANAFWFMHYLTVSSSGVPPLLAIAYRFYAVPLALALFLRARRGPRSSVGLLFDLLQATLVLILMFVGLFYLPAQDIAPSARTVLALHLGDDVNLGLCLAIFLRYRFEPHQGLRRIYARVLIFVAVYTLISLLANRLSVTFPPEAHVEVDLLWSVPYLLVVLLALSWRPAPTDTTFSRPMNTFRSTLMENFIFAGLVLAVAVLSDRLARSWHVWGNVAVGISLLIYSLRLTVSETHLQKEIRERQAGEDALRLAHDQLEGLLADAQCRETELQQLGELVRLVQSCLTEEEACRVIAEGVENLLPYSAGSVYVVGTPESAHTVATWGLDPPSARAFLLQQCWAARSSTVHSNTRTGSALQCEHLGRSPRASICAPLVAQGELVGLIVALFDHAQVAEDDPTPSSLRRGQIVLEAVAEHVSPALTNLKLRQSLRDQAVRDPLTGLFNRRYMEETLAREVQRSSRKQHPLSLLMLDLDHFKRYNDRYGHAAGDTVLRRIGDFLRSRTRTEDVACRYGGEEFVIILVETASPIAAHRAEDIRSGIKQLEIIHDGHRLDHITASVGVVSASAEIFERDALLHAADAALYRSKEKGRDCVTIASPSLLLPARSAATSS